MKTFKKFSEAKIDKNVYYKVDIEGLPPLYLPGEKGVGKIKTNLRKLLKRPDMVNDMQRQTGAQVRKAFRMMGQGKEDETLKHVDEAVSPAQQAAIAINMKKAGKKPKEEEAKGLWANIRAKRARGEKMRKKGEKGAPTQDAIQRAQEDVERRADFQMTKKRMPDGTIKFVKAPKKKIEIGKGKDEAVDMTKPLKADPVKTKTDLDGLKKAVKFYDNPLKKKGYPEQESIKKEAVGPDSPDDKGEYDYEGEMAKNQLTTMIDAATELKGMLGDDDNLPEWVQSKITKATDYIDSVRDYLKSESES